MIKLMADNKKTMERLVLVTIIGITESLRTKAITIDESVRAIFSPYAAEMLSRQKISREIIELIEKGCLLENFESLLPHGLENQILTIKGRATELLTSIADDDAMDVWIEC